jgi:hypothetical protein
MQQVEPASFEDAPTADIVREAFDDARDLIRLEVEIAKAEVQGELAQVKRAAFGMVIAVGAALVAVSLFGVALIIGLGATLVASLVVAGIVLAIAAIAALVGYAMAPKQPLLGVRKRLQTEVHQLKERIA